MHRNVTLDAVRNLSPDFLPQRQWGTRQWFYANPLWYYHRGRTDGTLRPDPQFYGLVDPELRRLCHLALQAALRTTPSCQGHFYPRERFERIWEQLRLEQEQIRGRGLVMRDSEAGRTVLFHDPSYALPWGLFEDFYARAARHQASGYIGLSLPGEQQDLARELQRIAGDRRASSLAPDDSLTRLLHRPVFGISVRASSPDAAANEWRSLTDEVGEAVSTALRNKNPR